MGGKHYLVTGTDTGVGKTLVSCALLHQLHRNGHRTIGMKPISAGCIQTAHGLINEDCEALQQASSIRAPQQWVNPYFFQAPIAPHIAASKEGRYIDLGTIVRAFERLTELADSVIVEGVGGFKVPIDDRHDFSHLAEMLRLPVILVVGMRLGCLNHALLTEAAINVSGLRIEGWVANCIDPDMLELDANIKALEQRMSSPLLGIIPYGKILEVRSIVFNRADCLK